MVKKTALISVYNKTGIVTFTQALIKLGYQIISTGGTYTTLKEHDIPVKQVSELTGFPEVFDGRVKTLHPLIFGGLLYVREDEKHLKQINQHSIDPIDMVVVNLYPYAEAIKKPNATQDEIIENIDIGGPSLLRAAAKNYKYVDVLFDPADYDSVISEIEQNGSTTEEHRLALAQKVFAHTSAYDTIIARTITTAQPPTQKEVQHIQHIRYGENPHQPAEYIKYSPELITQLHGKELSYNNLLDIDVALKTIFKFSQPTVAIIKHTNPCGIASNSDVVTAYQRAFATDTISPFGGIVVTNRSVDLHLAETINKVFTEIIIAPAFTEEALAKLKKKKDRRLITFHDYALQEMRNNQHITSCLNGFLSQTPDLQNDDVPQWTFPTQARPNAAELDELRFAWQVVKMLKSNAICLCRDMQTIGMGIGQTNRIDSLNIAAGNATRFGHTLQGAVCASDGFFPFKDSIERLSELGIRYVIQPGGSVGDSEVITTCNELGIAMVFTHRRHFRH